MDNNYDNTPEDTGTDQTDNSAKDQTENQAGNQTGNQTEPQTEPKDTAQEQTTYTDPNAGVNNSYSGYQQAGPNQGYSGYQQAGPNQGYSNYQQAGPNQNYTNYQQDNYAYNVGNNTGYNRTYDTGMDESPMSMGDWVLTILAFIIPCAGIVLYFVWAFGKSGNVNRRNFCRAQLVIMGVMFALYFVIFLIFGASMIASFGRYY